MHTPFFSLSIFFGFQQKVFYFIYYKKYFARFFKLSLKTQNKKYIKQVTLPFVIVNIFYCL